MAVDSKISLGGCEKQWRQMAKLASNRWQIQSSLSEGGQGRTFLVRDLSGTDPSSYVLKQLKNPNRVGRFANELAAIQKWSHPATVRLVDYSFALCDQVKNLVSYVNGSGEWMRIRVKSEWSGFSSQLASSGASADGTIKIASRRLRAKRSPIAASSRGAGV